MTTESKHQQAAKSIRSGELKGLFHLSDVADMVNSSLKAIVGSFSSDNLAAVVTDLQRAGVAGSIIATNNATAMGGAAGHQVDDKKRQDDVYDRLLRAAFNGGDWLGAYNQLDNPYDKYRFLLELKKEAKKELVMGPDGQPDWIASAKKLKALDEKTLQQRGGETDDEYKERIKQALLEKYMDKDGRPKQGQEKSPFAKWLFADEKLPEAERNFKAYEREYAQKIFPQKMTTLDQRQDKIRG